MGRVSPHALSWMRLPEGRMGANPAPEPPPAPRNPTARRPAAADVAVPRSGRHPLLVCARCNVQFRNCDLPQQPDCRGPGAANRTCKCCQKVLGISVMARKNHEQYTHSEESLRQGGIGKLSKKQSGARERERDDVSGTRYVGRCRGTRSRV